ncbi:uncharacterized protein LOC122027341 [Zingiber officinale]|uniref:uncharacterized protein LOC122027341 n=1 Tax=Zingiber officinale TaxID=94328 RepID=UPI001C4B61F3|nr:uncharacterized protein LOC122027341 [Zingiber officinale]
MTTMAITLSHSNIIIPRNPTEKSRRACLCHNSKIIPAASVSINKLPRGIKVFEDQEMGVTCFRYENGEIVCEGFDEGPRFVRSDSVQKRLGRRNKEFQIPSFLKIYNAGS